MIGSDAPIATFVVLALASQILLVGFFAAYRWRRSIADRFGWLVYAPGLPAAVLGAWYLTTTYAWWLAVGPLLFAAWAGLGYVVDIYRPANWRSPPRWSILIPYIVLLWVSLFGLWMPLWRIGMVYWLAFGVMLAIHMTLNITGHARPTHSGSR